MGWREVCTGFRGGGTKGKDVIGQTDVHGKVIIIIIIIIVWIFRKLEGVVGTGWCWLRIGTGGGHL
jgi:hypothetical protein